MLGVGGAGQRRAAVEQRGAVVRREQPLVRVDDEASRRARCRRSGGGPTGRASAGAAVGAVDVQPQAELGADGGDRRRGRRRRRRWWCRAVATTANTVGSRSSRRARPRSAAPVHPARGRRRGRRARRRPSPRAADCDRGVRLARWRRSGSGAVEPAVGASVVRAVAGGDQCGQVAGRAAGDEHAAGLRRGARRGRRASAGPGSRRRWRRAALQPRPGVDRARR